MSDEGNKVVELPPTRMVYTFHSRVVSIEKVTEKHNYRKKDPAQPPSENNVDYDTRTIGYTVRMEDGSAIGLFPEEPPWKIGDVITHSMSKDKALNPEKANDGTEAKTS
jgi:hypothetical protein